MKGCWQKEVPKISGQYWSADRQGRLAGLKVVAYLDTKLVFVQSNWEGWFWSEPIEHPPDAPLWDALEDETRRFFDGL